MPSTGSSLEAAAPRRQVVVRRWSCASCGQGGSIFPIIDLEGSPYPVAEAGHDIMQEHFLNTPKGERCSAFILLHP